MGLLRSLVMMLIFIWFIWLPCIVAQPPDSADALDVLLQDYAYRAFVRPKTGIVYDGTVPSYLSGIKVAAMRLRSGSLRRKGVDMYKEFEIPSGVIATPFVERLVLVYQNLGNWSHQYYPLPGYTQLTPVLGLLAYSASNLSATNLQELDARATDDPIMIKFSDVKPTPDGSVPKCVWFDLQGSPKFSNLSSENECSTDQQGHFSIAIESIAPSPEPVSPPSETPNVPKPGREEKKSKSRVGIIVGSVLGGVLLLVLLSFLVLWVHKLKEKKKMQQMEKAAEAGESLQMTSVGETRAPAAMVTRTQPTLENEYVP